MAGRALNVLVGFWLFISAFLWTHHGAQFANAWILGIVCVVFAYVAMRAESARYLNTALAVWLFLSVFILGSPSVATRWCNILTAIAIFGLSLMPSERVQFPTQTPRTV